MGIVIVIGTREMEGQQGCIIVVTLSGRVTSCCLSVGGGVLIVVRTRETEGGRQWRLVGDSEGALLLLSSCWGASPVVA